MGTIERAVRELWTGVAVILHPFWYNALRAFSMSWCLDTLSAQNLLRCMALAGLPTLWIFSFLIRHCKQGLRLRFLIMARRALYVIQRPNLHLDYWFDSLLGVISGVCHYTEKEYLLYTIRALYGHPILATLNKGCIDESAPYRLHQLMLAVSLKVGTWRLVHLGELLILAVKICTELQ